MQRTHPIEDHPPVYSTNASGAIQMQPAHAQGGQMQWMNRPSAPPGCPPGLEYLAQLDQLLVRQMVEMFEVLVGWETSNKYRVFNSMGQQCYYAFEESDCCSRLYCGAARGFTIHIVDNTNTEVIRVHRPFKCIMAGYCGCCLACQHEVQIEAPPGNVVGFAHSLCYCCNPSFLVYDASHNPVFEIEGPCIFLPRCGDYDFNINTCSDPPHNIGRITKQWSGFLREAFTDADNFGITFPGDLAITMKATLLGVLFLIDYMFFEHKSDNNSGGFGGFY